MDSESKTKLLPIIVIIAVAAFGAQKFMQKNNQRPPDPVPVAQTPAPLPTPIAMPTPNLPPEPTPMPTVAQTPPPPPTPPMAGRPPGMPNIPANMLKNMQGMDQAKAREMMMQMMKNGGMPKDFDAKSKHTQDVIAHALDSEANAREAIKELEACANQPAYAPTESKMPGDFAAQLQQAQDQAKASCVSTGKEIGKKYPSLQGEVDSKILKNGKP